MADNNPFPNENNTGHIWDDDLRELANDPPKWWMLGFWASILIVIVYFVVYPAIPWFGGATKGMIGWTALDEYRKGVESIEEVRSEYENQIAGMSAEQILGNTELSEYTLRSAKVLFGDKCAACHGTGGAGNPDYPVLADNDWLYGGSIQKIQESITNGRQGIMPAMGGAQLTPEEVDKLAVAIVNKKPTDEPLFTAKGCIACHGPDGTGVQMLGAANLTDSIYRFGTGTKEEVAHTIIYGVNNPADAKSRNAVMPKFGEMLTDTEIKKLAVYVHKLGGGQ